ncbi:uncharacterized protein KD926_009576 [Aspergillus affinis]|uniref:uncharacterized protein n=1 Tax=Aspergillus affinis TaxID=1070780 RepID=UPI0022FDB30B|nr:uncharacterized protein KD926_009576 [Aspergillus affinis]KAI9045162.1 hypothetical protein KD926_009576 [Aspergillus affinis]
MAEETKRASTSEALASPAGDQNLEAQTQLTAAVDDLLDQLQHKFDNVSQEMFGKRAQSLFLLLARFSISHGTSTVRTLGTNVEFLQLMKWSAD